MPCFHPLQATFSVNQDGSKNVEFSHSRAFALGVERVGDSNLMLPCGRCMGCRLERSRQWGLRCLHESKLYEDNCFVTLTFDDVNLVKECPDGSLNKKHIQDFMKRLRRRFDHIKIRVFYCGEYGESLGRPHYHLCLFNFDFPDKRFFKSVNGQDLFVSDILSELWPFGHHGIGSLTFESACYVARYCTKKITGKAADDHYCGRLPEFAQASLKPGIGRGFVEQFGESDIFPFDECVVRGARCKPPRYYDKFLEKLDPERFQLVKDRRRVRAEDKADDNSYRRLLVKEKCLQARFNKLVRTIERSSHVA